VGVCTHAQSCTTVLRMEMAALLNGLEWIYRNNDLSRASHSDRKLEVLWISDRLDLVNAISGLAKRNEKKNPDQWAGLAVFETAINVHAYHVKRNTHPVQAACDHAAGAGRTWAKKYVAGSTRYYNLTPVSFKK
jgi:ribonuclease HI